MRVKVSSKGQVVIPKDVREKLGIKPGTVLNVRVERNRIVLEPTLEPPDVFVEFGRSENILKELRRESEERIRRLLRDLGVEDSD